MASSSQILLEQGGRVRLLVAVLDDRRCVERDPPAPGGWALRGARSRHDHGTGGNLQRYVAGAPVHPLSHEIVDGGRAGEDGSWGEPRSLPPDLDLLKAAPPPP